MRSINQEARKTLDALTKGLKEVGDHRKIENGAFMPLSIEIIDSYGRDEGLMVSICHYGEQNGDLMRDPEVCLIKAKADNNYYPYYFRNDYLGVEQFAVEFEPDGSGIASYLPKRQREIAVFCGQWAQNLKEQGFIKALQAQIEDYDPDSIQEQKEVCFYAKAEGVV